MSKKIIVCIDGTGNQPADRHSKDPDVGVTNVLLLSERLVQSPEQITVYVSGIGASGNRILDFLALIFGIGWNTKRDEARKKIAEHYVPGDFLVLVGFSRGAAIARDLANELVKDGIETTVLALWDCVAAFGLPTSVPLIPQSFNLGKHLEIANGIKYAYHAVALDEIREPFMPSLLAPVAGVEIDEVWFAGDHLNVGGGRKARVLSDIALEWMIDRLRQHNLKVTRDSHTDVVNSPPSPSDVIRAHEFKRQTQREVRSLGSHRPRIHRSVLTLISAGYTPLTLQNPPEQHYDIVD